MSSTARGRKPKDPRMFDAVDFAINDAVAAKMYNALMVINLDPNINYFLKLNDLKALSQVQDAIEDYRTSYQESNIDTNL